MATISAIRDGLKARLDTIPGLRASAKWPGQIMVPAAVVTNGETRFDVTMDGLDDFTMSIVVLVQNVLERIGQDNTDAYRSPSGASSIAVAVHGDPTLGGVVHYSRVVSAGPDRIISYAGVDYFGCEFTVEIGH